MSIKKLLLCFVFSLSSTLVFAQSELTVFNASDTTYHFTINNNPCEATSSCAITPRNSVVLTEQQLAQICNEQNQVCNIVFGVETMPAAIGTAKYSVRDGIIQIVVPTRCKFCVEETDKHTFTLTHRVL